MSESTSSFVFQNVWEEKSDELAKELVQFWIDHKALEQAEAERRVDQAAMVVREAAGTLAAVSTVKLGFNRSIGHRFCYFRAFVAPPWRRLGLAAQMIKRVTKFFDERFDASDPEAAIGMFVAVENRALMETRNEAIWPQVGFVFVGRDPAGRHLRVRYFDGARIKP